MGRVLLARKKRINVGKDGGVLRQLPPQREARKDQWWRHRWSASDFLVVGIAALCISLFARHVLGVELGYWIFSWIGMILTPIGIAMVIWGRMHDRY